MVMSRTQVATSACAGPTLDPPWASILPSPLVPSPNSLTPPGRPGGPLPAHHPHLGVTARAGAPGRDLPAARAGQRVVNVLSGIGWDLLARFILMILKPSQQQASIASTLLQKAHCKHKCLCQLLSHPNMTLCYVVNDLRHGPAVCNMSITGMQVVRSSIERWCFPLCQTTGSEAWMKGVRLPQWAVKGFRGQSMFLEGCMACAVQGAADQRVL